MMITGEGQLRALAIISAVLAAAFVAIVFAGLTNWGRYPLTLESTFIVVPVVICLIIALALDAWAFSAACRPWARAIIATAAFAAVVFTAAIRTHAAFGQWFITSASADVDRNDDQVLRSDGRVITYHLELRNPFAKSAETYLVGTLNGSSFRIRLPIARIVGYAEPTSPGDWVKLSPTPSPSRVVARLTVDPSTPYTFIIDLQRQTVVK